MKVSIVIPTYNRFEMLKRAIRSVLRQTFTDYEILVMDDYSTDETSNIPALFFHNDHIRYFRLPKNSGGSMKPRSMGIGASTGEYIAILDDDSFWIDRNKLALQVEYLNQHPKCVLVGTQAQAINQYNQIIHQTDLPRSNNNIKNKLIFKNCFFHSSVMYRRDVMINAGGYRRIDDGYYKGYSNDYELWLRLGLLGDLVNLSIYGVGYIPNNNKMTLNQVYRTLKHFNDTYHQYKDNYPRLRFQGVRRYFTYASTILNTIYDMNPLAHYRHRLKRGVYNIEW